MSDRFADAFAYALSAAAPWYRQETAKMRAPLEDAAKARPFIMRHPAYPELVRRYRQARTCWAEFPSLRDAAAGLRMSEREYCDRCLAEMSPITWTASTTTAWPISPLMCDLAYADAAV